MVLSFREKGKRKKDTGSRANVKGVVMSLENLSVPEHARDPLLTSNCHISKPLEAVSQ